MGVGKNKGKSIRKREIMLTDKKNTRKRPCITSIKKQKKQSLLNTNRGQSHRRYSQQTQK